MTGWRGGTATKDHDNGRHHERGGTMHTENDRPGWGSPFSWLYDDTGRARRRRAHPVRDALHELGELLVAILSILLVYGMAREGIVGGDAAVGFLGATIGYVFGRTVGNMSTGDNGGGNNRRGP